MAGKCVLRIGWGSYARNFPGCVSDSEGDVLAGGAEVSGGGGERCLGVGGFFWERGRWDCDGK